MSEVENSIRDAMRSREDVMEPARERLLPGVRAGVRRRRAGRFAAGAAGLAAVTALAVAGAAVWPRNAGEPTAGASDPPAPVPSVSAPPYRGAGAPAGFRLESSLGAQIAVPEGWAVNNYGCGQDERPSVVRGLGAQDMCLTPEPETKELAILLPTGLESTGPELPMRAVTIAGRSASRGEGRTADGRYAGRIVVAGSQVDLTVRTKTAELTTRILDSFEFVDPDHVGCGLNEPARAVGSDRRPALAPDNPEWISICNYTGGEDRRLWSSTRITGAAAAELARVLNQAPAGGNPDAPPGQCMQTEAVRTDVVLLVRWPDGTVAPLWVVFGGCKGRGVSDGARTVRAGTHLLRLIFTPLGSGYGFNGDLDGGGVSIK